MDTRDNLNKTLEAEGIEMPDVVVNEIADHFESQMEATGLTAEQKSMVISMVVAGLAAFTLFRSDNAEAMGSFIRAVVNGITGPLASMGEAILGPVMSIFGQGQEDNATTNVTAVASAADAMNAVEVAQYNQTVQANLDEPPQACEARANAERGAYGEASVAVMIDAMNRGLMAEMLKEGPNDRASEIRWQNENIPNGRALDASTIYNDIESDEDREAANAFLRNVAGAETRSPRMDAINRAIVTGDTRAADRMQAEKATAACRRQIALRPLSKELAEHDRRPDANGTPRPTSRSIMQEEIDRTYGKDSAEFRAQIRDYVGTAPLLKECINQQTRSNYLLTKQCDELREGNMVAAVELLEMLDHA